VKDIVICAAKRTPIGSYQGALKEISASQLGAGICQSILEECQLEPEAVQELIAGCVLPAGQGMNPARQIALLSGLSVLSTAMTINRVCGSGLQAIVSAAQEIALGEMDCILAGGMESMSRVPFLLAKARSGYRFGHDTLFDGLLLDGLWDPFHDIHMGLTAETLADRFSISRQEQDGFALESQNKAVLAIKEGRFKREIHPVTIPQAKGDPILFASDEYVRTETSMERLSKLKPAFRKDGTVTAGNSSGINDGAAFLLITSSQWAETHRLKPRAIIRSWAVAGVEPIEMGLGPIPAVKKALERSGNFLQQMDVIELNEAFAAQSLAVLRQLNAPSERVNPNGGAIALGHPIGASGARILVTLLHELERSSGKLGLATLCIGGGQGIAMVIERV
jgi:acetyl-CoA C-acetyltransferase